MSNGSTPIWFTARVGNKNVGTFTAVPIGRDPVTDMIDYRIELDDNEVFIVRHNPEKPMWMLLYRALEASLFGEDQDDELPVL